MRWNGYGCLALLVLALRAVGFHRMSELGHAVVKQSFFAVC